MKYGEITAATVLPIAVGVGMTLMLPGFMSPAAKYVIPLVVLGLVWLAIGAFVSTRMQSEKQRRILLGAFSIGLSLFIAVSPFVAALNSGY
jgi:hypothetical protein